MTDPQIETAEVATSERTPVTVAMLASIVGGTVFIVSTAIGCVLWINAIGTTAKDGITENTRKIDGINVKLEAATIQRDLSMRNRDLQIEGVKSDLDRVTKRQDAAEQITADMMRKVERVLVLTESIKQELVDAKQRPKP